MSIIQITGVSPELRHELERRASRAGMELTPYLLRELGRVAAEPVVDDVLDRISARGRVKTSESPAEIIRRARGDDQPVAGGLRRRSPHRQGAPS